MNQRLASAARINQFEILSEQTQIKARIDNVGYIYRTVNSKRRTPLSEYAEIIKLHLTVFYRYRTVVETEVQRSLRNG